jgi:hypothetical protein
VHDIFLVDYPEVFVVMPFRESSSNSVFEKMIRPAVEGVKFYGGEFRLVKGDMPPRVGRWSQKIW